MSKEQIFTIMQKQKTPVNRKMLQELEEQKMASRIADRFLRLKKK
jgi:hypothetical protein